MSFIIFLSTILVLIVMHMDDLIEDALHRNSVPKRTTPIMFSVIIVLVIIFLTLYQQIKYEKVIDFCIENNLTDKLIKKYPDIKSDVINELKSLEKEK